MSELDEQKRLEQMDISIEFIATLVASYLEALIKKGVPPELASEMVGSVSFTYWDRHMCNLHGDPDDDE